MKAAENKMGIWSVNKLLVTMAFPMICSMLVQALYNVIDSIYVSKISEEALTAVSLVFPIQNFMTAVGSGIGVGMNAVLSHALGEKNYTEANESAWCGMKLALAETFVFVLFGIFFSYSYFSIQTTDTQIRNLGISYNKICCCLSIGAFMQMYVEKLLQSTGKTFYSMLIQGTGAVINIILDPIFIFGYLGFSPMGVKGAALATVIGQFIASILGFYFHYTKNYEVKIQKEKSYQKSNILKKILKVGIPSVIMQSLASIMVYGVNLILMNFISVATAVFGVYYKLQSFAFMPAFGLSNAMIPIIAYNYGAKKKERIKETLRLSMLYITGIMIVSTIIFQFFPRQLMSLFHASDEMKKIGYVALRILSCNFIFAGISVVLSSLFQAVGKSIYSMWISVFRQLVFLLPIAFLLSLSGELTQVWWSYPIAAVGSAIVSVIYLRKLNLTICL